MRPKAPPVKRVVIPRRHNIKGIPNYEHGIWRASTLLAMPSVAGVTVPVRHPADHINTFIKKVSEFVFRFRARTRVILVFLGSIFVIGTWVMPWYTNLYWMNSYNAQQAALNSGYQATNLLSSDTLGQKYGFGPLQDEYSGSRLAHGSTYMRSLGFSQQDLYWWIALAVLSLIALKTFEWQGRDRLRDAIFKFIEGAKAIALVRTIAVCVWRSLNFTSLLHVQSLARFTLLADLQTHGINNPGLQYVHTGFSQGLVSLFLGLILCFLGVFSATNTAPKKPRWWRRKAVAEPLAAGPIRIGESDTPSTAIEKIRVTAGVFAMAAIVFLVLAASVLG
jgi:hypothetical protein